MAGLPSISSGAGAAGALGAVGGSGGASTGLVTIAISTGDAGSPLDPTIRVMSVSINKEINKIPFAKLVILDADPAAKDFPVSDLGTLVPGEKIQIELGY